MSFITKNGIGIIDVKTGLKMEYFSDYQELVETCLSRLDVTQLNKISQELIPEIIKNLRNEKGVSYLSLPKSQQKSNGKITQQISAAFVRRVQQPKCKCGRDKTIGMPLCGICFNQLPREMKDSLRRKKGSALETAYTDACDYLQSGKQTK